MATKKNFIYLDLVGGGEKVNPISTPEHFEFEESDIWNLTGVVSNEPKRSVFGSRAPKKIIKRNDHGHGRAVAATSLPVKVPDWSKILRGEYKNRRIDQNDDDEDINGNDEDDDRIPPHEYLARTRIASFSVHEGIGRTLKGRDLRRVRNAIWKQTGFED